MSLVTCEDLLSGIYWNRCCNQGSKFGHYQYVEVFDTVLNNIRNDIANVTNIFDIAGLVSNTTNNRLILVPVGTKKNEYWR